jgi:hypothetical protein
VPGQFGDHRNGNTLDNRRSNLRLADKYQNAYNSRLHRFNTSGTPGVEWDKSKKRWRVRFNVNGRRVECGSFKNKDDAVAHRHEAAMRLHGEFACHLGALAKSVS